MSTTATMSTTTDTTAKDKEKENKKAKTSGPGPSYLDHHFRSNQNVGPRKTPTIPNGGVWSVYAETDIKAPPKYAYDAIVDIHSWRDWNSFIPDVLITKHPRAHSRTLKMEQGTFMTFTVQITPAERLQSKMICQHLEPLKHRADGHSTHASGGNITRIRWTSDNANLLTPGFILKQERVNEIEETGTDGNSCKYRTWITFAGMASKNLKKKYGEAYQQRVVDFVRDLRERCEKVYKEEGKNGGVGIGDKEVESGTNMHVHSNAAAA